MSHTRKNHAMGRSRAAYFSSSARRADRKKVDEIAADWNAAQAQNVLPTVASSLTKKT